MIIAATGFLLSLIVHVCSLFGIESPLGSATWLLHPGVFVVWLPAVLILRRGGKTYYDHQILWKQALSGCPAWIRYLTRGIFYYALVNFALFIISAPPKGESRPISSPLELRGVSGHWMAFYSMAFSVLYGHSRINRAISVAEHRSEGA